MRVVSDRGPQGGPRGLVASDKLWEGLVDLARTGRVRYDLENPAKVC